MINGLKTRNTRLIRELTKTGSADRKILGVMHTYTRGGLHGAKKCYSNQESRNVIIMMMDFSSYYPFIMLLYVPWFWSRMTKEEFESALKARIEAKRNGDKAKAKKLKTVINPAYGRARKENEELGFEICLIGQLLISDLLERLGEEVSSLAIIQTNTDGIIVSYKASAQRIVDRVVGSFVNEVNMPLELTRVHRISQQDINTYVAEIGETVVVSPGIPRYLQDEDHHTYKVKGVTAADIVKTAIAESIFNGKDVKYVINSCCDLKEFALTCERQPLRAKGLRWIVQGKALVLPDEVSVYATKDTSCGQVGSIDYTDLFSKLPGTSNHSIADINGNMTMNLLDKEFYITEANRYLQAWNKKGERYNA